MQTNDTCDTFLLTGTSVQYIGAGGKFARVHAEEGQSTDIWIGSRLERQRTERFVLVRVDSDFLTALLVDAFDSRNVSRSRQVVDHCVAHPIGAVLNANARNGSFSSGWTAIS